MWGLVAALYLANFVLLILNLPLIGIFTRVLGLPAWGLLPLVVAISYLGVFAITHAAFDVMVMVGFGILGFVLRKLDFSLVPVVLGLLLGLDMENNLRRALSISGADFTVLIQSPIALLLYGITAVFLVLSVHCHRG